MRITHKSMPKANKGVREFIGDLLEFRVPDYQHNTHLVK